MVSKRPISMESKEFVKAAAAKKGEKQTKGEQILIMNY
jgi:hypothetical protein